MRITMIMGNTPKVDIERTKPLRSESAGKHMVVEYLCQSYGREVRPVTARPAAWLGGQNIRRGCGIHVAGTRCCSAYFHRERVCSSGGGAGGAAESLVCSRDRAIPAGHSLHTT
jgi:hypothetical protein